MGKSQDLLHGVKLEAMLTFLVENCGWKEMSERIPIRCFQCNVSIKSSLTFLRKTPWAKEKVTALYLKKVRSAIRKDLKNNNQM